MKQALSNKTNKPHAIKQLIYNLSIWGCVGFISEIIRGFLSLGFTSDIFKGDFFTVAPRRALFIAVFVGIPCFLVTRKSDNKK